MSPVRPFRCFDSRAIAAALAVAAWLIVSAWWSRRLAPDSTARVLLALVQAAALATLVFAPLRRSITRLDELGRQIHYQALAVVGALMVTVITGWAFLERAGLPHIDWSTYAAPAFTVAWALGVILIARRYE